MANPSITYTFTNGTAADATAVNTNFNDLINGLTDGTKDLSVFAITAASNVNFQGNVTLGNSSVDDITFNGALESNLPVGTNNSYDIGSSTLGLAGVYLGASGGFTTRLISGATASHTLTLPPTSGSDGYVLRNIGSGTTYFHPLQTIGGIFNYSIACSVSGNALTISLKGADGNDPSTTNRVTAEFRNSTLATGTPSFASATSATSLVFSSGSTLGHKDGATDQIHVYLINNAGTLEVAGSTTRMFDEASRYTTTAEGGAGGADSRTTLYSTSARTNVAVKYICTLYSTQATAGTWASTPSIIALSPSNRGSLQEISEVQVTGIAGYGATGTRIFYFVTTDINVGTGVTFSNSSTNGASFTINEQGMYKMEFSHDYNAAGAFGISLDASSLTASIATLANTEKLAVAVTSAADQHLQVSAEKRLYPGQIVRAHGNAGASGVNSGLSTFRIVKISD